MRLRLSVGYKYFSDEESRGLDPDLMKKLDLARAMAGIPFKITSGLRTPDANVVSGGVENSSHLKGKAVDLAVSNSRERFMLIRSLLAAGITRIGAYNHHIHVDTDNTKDPEVFWVGLSH